MVHIECTRFKINRIPQKTTGFASAHTFLKFLLDFLFADLTNVLVKTILCITAVSLEIIVFLLCTIIHSTGFLERDWITFTGFSLCLSFVMPRQK